MKIQKEKYNILIVDDVSSNLIVLADIVKQAGYVARPVATIKQAMIAITTYRPDLILLDVSMPEINGFDFCRMLKENDATKNIMVIFISAMDGPNDRAAGFQAGGVDYIVKPFEFDEITRRIELHLNMQNLQDELEEYNNRLQKFVQHQNEVEMEQYKVMSLIMSQLISIKCPERNNHLENVSHNAYVFAMSLQLLSNYEELIDQCFITNIQIAAPFHDFGMFAIPEDIHRKQGKLTEEELEVIRGHIDAGQKCLKEMYHFSRQDKIVDMILDVAQFHHENYDGTGYPRKKKGKEIPLAARIVAIVDTYDVLRRNLCYRSACTHEEAVEIIAIAAGKQFDPDLVAVFLKIQKQMIFEN